MRFAIIGTGSIALYHVKGIKEAGEEIVAAIDVNLASAKKFAKKYDIPNIFSSLNEALNELSFDAVTIAVPNAFHASLCIEAMKSNLDVFCEKPPAMNANEMVEIMKVQEETGKFIMFNFNNRARFEVQSLKKYINSGDVGVINSVQAKWIRRRGIPGFGGWFTNKKIAGGGPTIDLIHMLDLALYFMDFPKPTQVLAVTYDTFMGNPDFKGPWGIPDKKGGKTDVETACHAMITFSTGQSLMVRNSWAEMNKNEIASVVFQGTKAGGKVERFFTKDGDDKTALDSCELYTTEYGYQVNRTIDFPRDESMGRLKSVQNFIDSLSGNAKPLNNLNQALILMEIIDAIYESADKGISVSL